MDDLQEIEKIQNSLNSIELEEDESETRLEIPKRKKRVPTPKQLEVLRNAREKALLAAKEKKTKKMLEDEAIQNEVDRRLREYKKGLEDKILKKAVSIKKKEIKRQAALDDISDDDTPMEKIKEIATKRNHPPAQEKPKYIFV